MSRTSDKLDFEFPNLYGVEPDFPRTVGIEIETEAPSIGIDDIVDFAESNPRYWVVTQDGSLIQGYEFVSKPLSCEDIVEALNELSRFGSDIYDAKSVRTSVHIHVDCRRISPFKVLEGFILIEPYLTGLYIERDDNLYCSSWNCYATDFLLEHTSDRNLFTQSKYKSFSMNRYNDLKTVEYRFLPLLNDPTDIVTWANFLSWFTDSAGRVEYNQGHVMMFGEPKSFEDLVTSISTTFGDKISVLFRNIVAALVPEDSLDRYVFERTQKFCLTDTAMAFEIINKRFDRSEDYV